MEIHIIINVYVSVQRVIGMPYAERETIRCIVNFNCQTAKI